MNSARESVLRWFVAFTVRFRRSDSTSESSNVNQSVVSISSTEGSEPPSPASDHNRFSPARNKEYLQDASEVIRKVLYSTRSNIRLLHEVFRQVWKKNYTQMCGCVRQKFGNLVITLMYHGRWSASVGNRKWARSFLLFLSWHKEIWQERKLNYNLQWNNQVEISLRAQMKHHIAIHITHDNWRWILIRGCQRAVRGLLRFKNIFSLYLKK